MKLNKFFTMDNGTKHCRPHLSHLFKKTFLKTLVLGAVLIMFFGFVGCDGEKVHDIPNGNYTDSIEGGLKGFPDYYWRIKGNDAILYYTPKIYYKCKIVNEKEKIFFIFDGEDGRGYHLDFSYQAEYDELSKKLSTKLLTYNI